MQFDNKYLREYAKGDSRNETMSTFGKLSSNNKKMNMTKFIHIRPPVLPVSKNIINLNLQNSRKASLSRELKKLTPKKVFNNSIVDIKQKQSKNIIYRIDNIHD